MVVIHPGKVKFGSILVLAVGVRVQMLERIGRRCGPCSADEALVERRRVQSRTDPAEGDGTVDTFIVVIVIGGVVVGQSGGDAADVRSRLIGSKKKKNKKQT